MSITILDNKRIILGVTGSIACYKSVDLASKLAQAGAEIDVVMTEAAERFVSPLTFRSVTSRQVFSDMWTLADHVRHVRLGEEADLLLIAPATAHTIAKIAHGLADNLLSLTALTVSCPMLIAPAMDAGMYMNPATQSNVSTIRNRGVTIAGPAEGRMASGLEGLGRMLEPVELLGHIRLELGKGGILKGKKVVITAGPTQEPLDPVRYLTNRSSGRQGYALAQAAVDAGAEVSLVSGPVNESVPVGASVVNVRTAIEMGEAVLDAIADADALLMTAAVADFRPAEMGKQKIKKAQAVSGRLGVPLVSNPDILELVKIQKAKSGKPLITLGFAAETEKLIEHASEKLERKSLDFIAVNDVSAGDSGFSVESNRITLISADGVSIDMPLQSKIEISERIIKIVADKLASRPV
jgi:phosphopantothenoylcysteine decarboxylase/phosphopantothenate--cysteine ligase